MFVKEKKFIKDLEYIEGAVDKTTNNQVSFEEYVVVPCFGFIILRFNLNIDSVSPSDLDKYETRLYEIVGNDYLVDFMGSVYRKVGVDYTKLSRKLRQLNKTLEDEPVEFNPPYKEKIQKDAEELLYRVGLDLTKKVWEIQIEDNEINLLLLGKESRFIKTIQDGTTINVYETNEEECTGLVRAIFNARRNKITLARLLQ